MRLHASNLRLALEFVECWGVEMAPPFEQHGVADKLEPRCELQVWLLEHFLKFGSGDIFGVADFVGIDVEINVRLDEEDIIDCIVSQQFCIHRQRQYSQYERSWHTLVFSPFSVTGGLVVYPGQELKLVEGNLLGLDAQLVVQLALSGSLDTQNSSV